MLASFLFPRSVSSANLSRLSTHSDHSADTDESSASSSAKSTPSALPHVNSRTSFPPSSPPDAYPEPTYDDGEDSVLHVMIGRSARSMRNESPARDVRQVVPPCALSDSSDNETETIRGRRRNSANSIATTSSSNHHKPSRRSRSVDKLSALSSGSSSHHYHNTSFHLLSPLPEARSRTTSDSVIYTPSGSPGKRPAALAPNTGAVPETSESDEEEGRKAGNSSGGAGLLFPGDVRNGSSDAEFMRSGRRDSSPTKRDLKGRRGMNSYVFPLSSRASSSASASIRAPSPLASDISLPPTPVAFPTLPPLPPSTTTTTTSSSFRPRSRRTLSVPFAPHLLPPPPTAVSPKLGSSPTFRNSAASSFKAVQPDTSLTTSVEIVRPRFDTWSSSPGSPTTPTLATTAAANKPSRHGRTDSLSSRHKVLAPLDNYDLSSIAPSAPIVPASSKPTDPAPASLPPAPPAPTAPAVRPPRPKLKLATNPPELFPHPHPSMRGYSYRSHNTSSSCQPSPITLSGSSTPVLEINIFPSIPPSPPRRAQFDAQPKPPLKRSTTTSSHRYPSVPSVPSQSSYIFPSRPPLSSRHSSCVPPDARPSSPTSSDSYSDNSGFSFYGRRGSSFERERRGSQSSNSSLRKEILFTSNNAANVAEDGRRTPTAGGAGGQSFSPTKGGGSLSTRARLNSSNSRPGNMQLVDADAGGGGGGGSSSGMRGMVRSTSSNLLDGLLGRRGSFRASAKAAAEQERFRMEAEEKDRERERREEAERKRLQDEDEEGFWPMSRM